MILDLGVDIEQCIKLENWDVRLAGNQVVAVTQSLCSDSLGIVMIEVDVNTEELNYQTKSKDLTLVYQREDPKKQEIDKQLNH